MANSYDDPEDNHIQRQYDDQLGQLADAERDAANPAPGSQEDGHGFSRNEDGPSAGPGKRTGKDSNDASSSSGSTDKPGLFRDEAGASHNGTAGTDKLSDIKGALQAAGGNPMALAKVAGNLLWGSKKRRRATVGVGLGGGGITMLVAGSIFFGQMKIESIINNVNHDVGAAASQALDTESRTLFERWVIKYIAPNLGKGTCHSTIDAGCVSHAPGDSPVDRLYNAWRKDKLEQRLAKRGLSIGIDKGVYYINTGGKRIDFGNNESDVFSDKNTTVGQRHEIENTLRARVKEGTFWERTYYRFKIAPLAKKEYGIRHCINACKHINKFTDSASVKKRAAKAYIVQRVITPLSESYGLLIGCVMDGGGGSDCSTKLEDAEPGETTKKSTSSKKLQENLDKYIAAHGAESLATLAKKADAISKDGFQKYLIKQAATKIAGKISGEAGAEAAGAATAEAAEKAIPVIGWVILAAQAEKFAADIGPTVQTLAYAANSAAAAQTYTAYETVASEMKSGQIDATQLSSFNSSLSTNLDGSSDDVSDAGSTPLYKSTIANAGQSTQTAFLGGVLDSTVSADATTDSASRYSQNGCDGDPVPSGQLVCEVEVLNRGSTVLNDISSGVNFLQTVNPINRIAVDVLAGLASFAGDLLGKATGPAFSGLCKITPSCEGSMNYLASKGSAFMSWLISKVAASSFSAHMSGGRLFDMIYAGAEVVLNGSCQQNLGCAHKSDVAAAEIRNKYLAEQREEFSHQALFARMFSTNSPYSLVSHLAVTLPTNVTTAGNQLASTLSRNPYSAFHSVAAALFTPGSANAATLVSNPFGVPQAAYSDDEIPKDPEAFFDAHCINGDWEHGDLAKYDATDNSLDISGWLNTPGNVSKDESTGQAVFDKPNPCLLIFSTVQAAGGMSDPSLLPKDVLNDDDTSSDTGAGTDFRLATFNVFHSDDDPTNVWQTRMRHSVSVLKTGQVDVAGLQETRANQQNYFKQNDVGGDTYDMWPDKSTRPDFTPNPIVWDKTKYKMVNGSGKKHSIKYGGDGSLDYLTEITLEDINPGHSGQQFIVLNTHDPADVKGGNAAQDRVDNAQSYVQFISGLKSRGLPVVFTGDFNNRYSVTSGDGNQPLGNKRDNLTYCILTKNGDMQDAYDAAVSGKSGACPSTSAGAAGNPVDHMFISTGDGVKASHFAVIGHFPANGSDAHNTLAVDVSIPASGDTGTEASGDIAWPVDQKWWTTNKSSFLKAHNGAGTFTSPNTPDVADDVSLPKGIPVYALAGGKVIKRPLGRSTYLACSGNTTPNNGGLEIQSQVQGGTLLVAYAHGDSVTTKDTVQAGDQIMKLGQVGNACGAHMHIDMSFNNKNVCPQDVFLALGAGQTPDFAALATKAVAPCGR
jgi:exonuclease III